MLFAALTVLLVLLCRFLPKKYRKKIVGKLESVLSAIRSKVNIR